MQAIIEEAVRMLGWGALKLATLGRYRGFEPDGLAEGAIGLGILIAFVIWFSR